MTFMTRFEDAWQAAQEGLQVSEEIGHREHIADILVAPVALYHLHHGDLEAAYQAALEGVNIAEQIGSIHIQSLGLWMLGEIARMRGQYQQALRLYQRSVQASEPMEHSFPMFLIMALSGLGSTYLAISAEFVGRVKELHDRALGLLGHPAGAMAGSVVWTELGWCLMSLGDHQQAGGFFQKGLTIPTPQMLLQRPRLLVGSAMLALAQGDLAGAAELVAQARLSIEASAMKNYRPVVDLTEAQVMNARGEPERALERLVQAEQLALELGLTPLVLSVRVEAARTLRRLGRAAEADEKLRQARAAGDEIAALFEDDAMKEKYLQHVKVQMDRSASTGF
jgi:tetratricopeptide (TPR) repeat protein